MFIVNGIRIGTCIACGRETECFDVQSQRQQLSGLLCVTDFKRQVKIVTATSVPQPPNFVEAKG
jgi:hypothetical protein